MLAFFKDWAKTLSSTLKSLKSVFYKMESEENSNLTISGSSLQEKVLVIGMKF